MRTPILLWGDLVKKNKAVTRRSLVGEAAHECMYAWVYLTEFLAVRRLSSNLEKIKMKSEVCSILSDFNQKTWEMLDRKQIDPHFQLNKATFETPSLLNAIFYSRKNPLVLPSVVELGQTFFTAIDKFNLIETLSKDRFALNYNTSSINWIGIDNSEFCNTTSTTLHDAIQQNITIYPDWKEFVPHNESIFHSRFVCSYAFQSTASLADFLSDHFDCAVIEDAFSINPSEISVYNHGQRETFFNLTLLNKRMADANFETYVLDYYGDWPSGSAPCLVVKILFLKKNLLDLEKFKEFLTYHGFNFELKDQSKEDILTSLLSKISSSQWKKIYRNKKTNPIWGKTEISEGHLMKNLIKSFYNKFLIFKNGYRSYNLSGRNADEAIISYINKKI